MQRSDEIMISSGVPEVLTTQSDIQASKKAGSQKQPGGPQNQLGGPQRELRGPRSGGGRESGGDGELAT